MKCNCDIITNEVYLVPREFTKENGMIDWDKLNKHVQENNSNK